MIKKGWGKPFVILLFFMAVVATHFWTTSRYPDLAAKAVLNTNAPLSGLGFSPVVEIKENFSVGEKVFWNTLNWMHTNKKGMMFSFMFGSFFLALMPCLNIRRTKSGFKSSLLGLGIGTPLGVCVNCAAPIARAMQASGYPLQTALAALIASPSLNLVVLMMAFSMFPFHVVAVRILLLLLFILVLIPLASRLFFVREVALQNSGETLCETPVTKNSENVVFADGLKGWEQAVFWSIKAYVFALLKLLWIALPLMILAGFLGGIAVTLLPWDMFHQLDMPTSLGVTALIMLVLSLLGTFLPSPIAFDVILSSILLQVGVPLPYVAVFFFTLGTFSIYAFLIIWRAVSFRVAAFLFLATVLLGVTAGMLSVAGESTLISKARQQLQIAKSSMANANAYDGNDPVTDRTTDDVVDYGILQPLLYEKNVKYTDTPSDVLARTPENISVLQSDFMPSGPPDKRFSRVYGDEVGISQPYLVSYTSFIPSDLAHTTMSVASGDVHNDGWPDLLVMGDHEVLPNIALYTNIGGQSFKRQFLPVTKDFGMVVLVSLADLNADHWLDVVFATYGGNNYVIYNDHGVFKDENMHLLHEKAGNGITMNLGYSDIDKDGDLDLFEGNWGYGPLYINRESSRDYILNNTGQRFEPHALEGLTGETLSAIFADINGDGNTDLYIGNDYIAAESSDEVFIGDGSGNFRAYSEEQDGLNLRGGQSSMSVEFSDIDNDLLPELYIGQIAFSGQYMESMSKIAEKQVPYEAMCSLQGIYGMTTEECLKTMRFRLALVRAAHYITDACENLDDGNEKNRCLIHMLTYKTKCSDESVREAVIFSAHPDDGTAASERYQEVCARSQEVEDNANLSLEHNLEVSNASLNNVLLHRGKEQTAYQDQANERKIGYGGWTWNARFADLDQDGWKDLYIANGYYFPMTLASNLFYRNKGDGQFDDKTKEYDLEDYSFSSAYSTVDIDRDGDLDIVTVPLDSSVIIYRNENHDRNNSILFTLDDQSTNNTFGYGATVVISYTANGQTIEQRQDVQSSGGYKSFNAPAVHFGLGLTQSIQTVKVLWSDGQTSTIEGSLESGKYYKIIRGKAE
ncbi:MAG: VCBS repeat-containing protein [Alphaproteobacteria bacterium]|nr:VCBS repeat-containing protein [Alphaproteobacteria bacterium]MCB9975884.1 VCBS repeat-containing protein [Rhodospirillales bacterium]